EPAEVGLAMEVLDAGALTIMPKPFGPGHPEYSHTAKKYLTTLKSMSGVKLVTRRPNLSHKERSEENRPLSSGPSVQAGDYHVLVIGASAGGPESTKEVISAFNTDFPIPIMLVQHVDSKFMEGYRRWLQSYARIPVLMANDDQALLPGHVYLAPPDKHLVVKAEGVAGLTDEAPVKGHRPSVGFLFKSAGDVYRNRVIAVILSGMGKDGVPEMKMLKDQGAMTIAQNEASSIVFGMPGEAVRIGAVKKILPSGEIASFVSNIIKKHPDDV
ncbi:MAG: chemotaxis protein CheB, partial [Bacteroidota bacterium]